MGMTARIMNISVREGMGGMFFATSEDEPTFFLAETSLDALWEALPCAVEHMFEQRGHIPVYALPTDQGDLQHRPFAIVPRDVIAQRALEAAC